MVLNEVYLGEYFLDDGNVLSLSVHQFSFYRQIRTGDMALKVN